MNTTLFQDILQNLNYSSFSNIQVKLVGISEPEIRTIINQDDNNSNDIHITDNELTYILVFGILGIIIIIYIYYKVFPKVNNYRIVFINNMQEKNKLYNILSNEKVSDNNIEMQKENSEESRIVEITNEECKF